MPIEEIDVGEMMESRVEDGLKLEKQLQILYSESSGNLAERNGLHDGHSHVDDMHDENLLQMLLEFKFKNEFFKSQYEGFKSLELEKASGQLGGESEDAKELHERIELLNKELSVERQTRGAAEEALKHLQTAYSEADSRAQELSAMLAEAQQNFDQEIKKREEKYSELDTKFTRLHKRAKQRIQEVQKLNDDLESQFRDVSEKAERASSQLSVLQQELERTRQQANESLKAMDVERQQLRSANNKLRDNIEELRHSLAPKENAIDTLQQSVVEKEQLLGDMRGLLQAADEKRQASIAELSAKHQKIVENLEAQIADAFSDRSKATETISSLQVLLAQKESKIAEMDIASTGEAARLRVVVESVKGELLHLKHEHEKEKESWEAASLALKAKLEVAESNCIRAEIEAAKMRSQLESELSVQTRLLNARDAELITARGEISRLESEFSSYKVRAHALLQKKDAEITEAKDNKQLNALEEALKEAEKEILSISEERDTALRNLQDALANHEKDLEERDAAINNAKQQIKSIESKLNSAISCNQSEKKAWETNLQNLEETWRLRCEALQAHNEVSSGQDLQMQSQFEELKLQYKSLKEDHDSFRDLADRMIEEKDKEILKLLDENENLKRSIDLRLSDDNSNADLQKQDTSNLGTSLAEQQILLLARQQAQREEELAQSQRHILALQEEIEELERENRLHSQQQSMLKVELRNMERSQKREGVDMTYLKNVILKLLETGEVEALLPVVGMLLQFSPEEIQKCQQAYRDSTDAQQSPTSEGSGSGSGSLFSTFSFS